MADTPLDKALNVRMNSEEMDRIEVLRQRLQVDMGDGVRVTQRTVILDMLKRSEAYYAKLDKDKSRER